MQPEVLNTLNPSEFPLDKLEHKIGSPLMLLWNLDSRNGLWNGIYLRLLRSTCHILKCRVLDGDNGNNVVFIPCMALDAGLSYSPVLFCCLEFPVHLTYVMTMNKSQGETVKHVGLNLMSSIFCYGQHYVALSHCTHLRNIKIKIPHGQEDRKVSGVVWTEVFRTLKI